MSEAAIPIKKAIPIIVVTWIISLVTTFAVVSVFFFPIGTDQIEYGAVTSVNIRPGAITTTKLDDYAVTTDKIADGAIVTTKIADGAVTSDKLAANAIPFNSTYCMDDAWTVSINDFEDMPDTSVSITLGRTSHLLIMFSTEAVNRYIAYEMCMRALVDTTAAHPSFGVTVTPRETETEGSYTYNFYLDNVDPGTHTIKIQWRVGGGEGRVLSRTLIVIALPA